jgi:cytochrome P450
MQGEIDETLEGRLPTPDDLARLKFVDMVFAESMRLYPPAWAMGRQVLEDYDIAGYVAPRGSIILMSPYVMHHDERYYPDPFKFEPLRWTEEARERRPRFSFFPFGGGPRVCIGEQFAWTEGVLLIATIAQMWKLSLVPGQTIKPRPLITLRPRGAVKMKVERRAEPAQRARAVEEKISVS